MSNVIFTNDDLANNPSTRCPVCLCLDVSGSMCEDSRINALNDGVQQFVHAVNNNENAKYHVEIAIVTFGNYSEVLLDFVPVTEIASPPILNADGETDLGGGVLKALEILQKRKQTYKDYGTSYYQPWLVLMTDGDPTTRTHYQAATEVCRLQQEKKLTVLNIGVGDDFNEEVLEMFHKDRTALKLNGLEFTNLFEWLAASVGAVSTSTPGTPLSLPPTTSLQLIVKS